MSKLNIKSFGGVVSISYHDGDSITVCVEGANLDEAVRLFIGKLAALRNDVVARLLECGVRVSFESDEKEVMS